MIRSVSAQIALLAFAAAIVAGLYAGNSPALVLGRALVAMIVALAVARVVCWSTKLVLRDHLQRKKFAIDQVHPAVPPAESEATPDDSPTVGTG